MNSTSSTRQTNITIWHLELFKAQHSSSEDNPQCRPSRSQPEDLKIEQAMIPSPELSRFLYTSVGGDWYWIDRLHWTYDRWMQYLDRPELETWVASLKGTPAGYIELEVQPDNSVKIAYFGLLKAFIGKGIGGYLLSLGIDRAWNLGATRIFVDTCSLDGEFALKNYQSRGFQIYKTETVVKELPIRAIGPWEGAYS
ncbi:GNAT family N-acetyltransferase [Leptolyngbya sp. FACHB-711]|uniref:GNAT family N-acetyltransferase n=1 Tax=unclassified Leptolyngbya TaxID=2650499 RepID=UPI0016865C93|nr:GNAT family N-acetyltransferase [Leptolyngbya sp. FACHB-711]MBD1853233.1 GNAT family N-acetyltransferase [Cyanobacteria bacterium FACHB-502]MBD2024656.1 GNAT family N-acetyltransferase [Leptolyngbya sp. FACHB-711]